MREHNGSLAHRVVERRGRQTDKSGNVNAGTKEKGAIIPRTVHGYRVVGGDMSIAFSHDGELSQFAAT